METYSDCNQTISVKSRTYARSKKKEYRTFLASGPCRYPVVRKAAIDQGWKPIYADNSNKAKNNCNLLWVDTANIHDYFLHIQPWQCINHFPGMTDIARKTRLAQRLEMMRKQFPKHYSFFPSTFILPKDLLSLKPYFANINNKSKQTFIVKPDGGCQGRGIFLTKSWSDLENLNTVHVVQRYITNPLLIENKKFDLRLYVLVTSCDPLRIYIYNDGLVRFCTEEFQKPNSKNLNQKCMHLTNYAINKYNKNFEQGSENCESKDDTCDESITSSGSKRSIKWFLSWVSKYRGQHEADKLWNKIGQICVKTILSVAPTLVREYHSTFHSTESMNNSSKMGSQQNQIELTDEQKDSMGMSGDFIESCSTVHLDDKSENTPPSIRGSRCFAILGFDVMINSKLKPFLIEVNHLPSFVTDSKLDEDIKYGVTKQALAIVKAKASDKKVYNTKEKTKHKTRFNRTMSTYGKENNYKNVKDNRLKNILNETLSQNRETNSGDQTNSIVHKSDATKIAKQIIKQVYLQHAPEKINKVSALLKRYKGYEEWLVAKIKEKYVYRPQEKKLLDTEENHEVPYDKENSNVQDDIIGVEYNESDDNSDEKESIATHSLTCKSMEINEAFKDDTLLYKEEISLLKDYECLYPSASENYASFEKFSFEKERQKYMRLTCPLPRPIAVDDCEKNQNKDAMKTNVRSDCRMQDCYQSKQNNYLRTIPPLKLVLPTQKQVAAAERLSKGMSVMSISRLSKNNGRFSLDKSETNATRERATLFGRSKRKKNEEKFISTRSQMILKEVNIELEPITTGKETIHTTVRDRCFVDFSGRTLGGAW